MSSSRFPGKVLAPFRGQPLIRHVIEAVRQGSDDAPLTVLTSTEPSDDPLAAYLEAIDINVFRGPLDDVFLRFRMALERYPSAWMMRVCGDSPLMDPEIIRQALNRLCAETEDAGIEVITNVFPRTVPPGHAVELIRSDVFLAVDPDVLSGPEREHVMPYFYNNAQRFRILTLEGSETAGAEFCVDSLSDLRRLEGECGLRSALDN